MNEPRCPSCFATLDGHVNPSNPEDHTPREGDLTVCCYCATVLTFEGGGLRRFTTAEICKLDDVSRDRLNTAVRYTRQLQAAERCAQ